MKVTVAEVRRRMLEKLAASGLTAKDADALWYTPMLAPPNGAVPAQPGFTIPYYSALDAEPTGFYRYRYLPALTLVSKNGDGTKQLRYSQPKLPPEPHFTPLLDWKTFLSLPKQNEDWRLFITEGELKAACATKLGFATVGLGGAWNFRSRTELFIKGLKNIDWKDARVYIAYDSDAVSNYQVMQGENALARELLEREAQVYIIRLPALLPGAKTGLDDYLVAHGAAAFEELISRTEPWGPSRALHELNEQVVFVRDPGSVVDLRKMQIMAPDKFSNNIFANRVWEEVSFTAKGEVKKQKKNAAVEWIKWPARGEVERSTYRPGRERILRETCELNMWSGWGVGPTKGDVSLWKKLLDYTFANTPPEERRWFEQWLAYPLQHPGTKLYTAVILHSRAQGAGKSLLAYTMRQIYGKNFAEISETDLHSGFNDWAAEKQMVFGEEITGGDKRATADSLKAIITRASIRINKKYLAAYDIPDCVNYIFASQHAHSFFLEDLDRRYFVHELKNANLGVVYPEFTLAYDSWYSSPAGAAALFYYFLNDIDTENFNPKAPALITAAKKRMIELGRSDASAWVAELRDTPENILIGEGVSRGLGLAPLGYTLMTSEEIFRQWQRHDPTGKLTKPGLARELRSGGFRQVNEGQTVAITSSLGVRLWAVQGDRLMLESALPAKLAAVYRKERGIQK